MKGRNKTVTKKTIKGILITDCIALLLGIIAFGPWSWNSDISMPKQITAIIILLIFSIILDILLWFILHRVYLNVIRMQESSLMVEKQLSKNKEIEIVPIRDDIPSLKALKEYSRFYAIYDGKNEISISIKVNDKEKKFFESLHKDYFAFYYKLKENR